MILPFTAAGLQEGGQGGPDSWRGGTGSLCVSVSLCVFMRALSVVPRASRVV
jgi:hypothetical protein